MKTYRIFAYFLTSIWIINSSVHAASNEYFSSVVFSDEGEEWIDLSQRTLARSTTKSKFRDYTLVMDDQKSERILNSQDYFSSLKFDLDGNLLEPNSISLDDILEDQEYFTATWEREQVEQVYFESRQLSLIGNHDASLKLLDNLRPNFNEQKAKLTYLRVQDLVVILRSQLSISDREKYNSQLSKALIELIDYKDQLNSYEEELVYDLATHAKIELQQSKKELDRLRKLVQQRSERIQTVVVSKPISQPVARIQLSQIPVTPVESRPVTQSSNSNEQLISPVSNKAVATAPSPITKARLSDRNPIMQLKISGPDNIGRSEAETILRGIGLMTNKLGYEKSLQGLYKGYTYKSNPNARLDKQMKGFLFNEYRLIRKALNKYSDKPTISQKATPQLYNQWMQKASLELTALGSQRERFALLKSLMTQESGRTHWRNFVPVMGYTADIGFGQFLPATAKSVGINPYDPEENMRGIAIYLNRLIKKKGVRNGLASYNGGNSPPSRSFRYADSIMSRLA